MSSDPREAESSYDLRSYVGSLSVIIASPGRAATPGRADTRDRNRSRRAKKIEECRCISGVPAGMAPDGRRSGVLGTSGVAEVDRLWGPTGATLTSGGAEVVLKSASLARLSRIVVIVAPLQVGRDPSPDRSGT
jgi:hypothetical protein